MKVKVIEKLYLDKGIIEDDINEFINNNNIEVIDIKFTEVMGEDCRGGHTAYILYEEEKK